jgi:hypothetical protein
MYVVIYTGNKHKVANISANFRKNLNGLNGALWEMIHEKNLKSKISCQTPFEDLDFACNTSLNIDSEAVSFQ